MNRPDTAEITPHHLARKSVVYLRQSSQAQVKQNTESQPIPALKPIESPPFTQREQQQR
jgi:hypothetical protein